MKFTFGNTTYDVRLLVRKSVKRNVEPALLYWSASKHDYFEIAKMQTDHIRNALLKQLGLTQMRTQESESIVRLVSKMQLDTPETLGLYKELSRRVSAGQH